MKFPEPIGITEIAEEFGMTILGDKNLLATGINEIHKVEPGDITFSDVKKYFKKSLNSAASIIILNEETECPPGKAILIAKEPFEVYNKLMLRYRPIRPLSALIDPSANVHPSTILEPGVIIGPHVVIGRQCHIMANAVICEHTRIGDHVCIQHGAVIGSDAFYYKRTPEGHKKWRSGGRVIIEDRVEIGSLCTVNKGVSGDKSILGDRVTLYGQVGVVHDVEIGSNTTVLAKSLISRSVEGGKTYNGIPVTESMQRNREIIAMKKLPEVVRKVEKL